MAAFISIDAFLAFVLGDFSLLFHLFPGCSLGEAIQGWGDNLYLQRKGKLGLLLMLLFHSRSMMNDTLYKVAKLQKVKRLMDQLIRASDQESKTTPKTRRYEVEDVTASVAGSQCTPANCPVNMREDIYISSNSLRLFLRTMRMSELVLLSNDNGLIQLSSPSASASSYVEFGDSQGEQLPVYDP
ncbi:hypothetical protein F3Y22_tig00002237pilonHSYRG00992 [Hibiscus syriacus]|uniref:Uncharacterized protein n=1 Tax=Hibiscus syriacus TaxID=106335 RepID=A0A6A3CY10_HIBSY|nr:hypothetical protein F3Y22_tig00002237pilonHSYRG00992 [Hibiscus syriacus]